MSPLVSYLLETMLTLAAVGALAAIVLLTGKRVGLGRGSGPAELLGKLPLDPRRAVYIVRVGASVYVLGASETGLVKLDKLPSTRLEDVPDRPPSRGGRAFREILGRLRPTPEPRPHQDPPSSAEQGS